MQDETLKIEAHYERLTLLALNKHGNDIDAAAELGISKRTLLRWKKRFSIRKDADGSYYQLPLQARKMNARRNQSAFLQPLIQ